MINIPAYKRQHYLPISYLREFAQPPDYTHIVMYDGINHLPVPVKSQCASKYFYSKNTPKEAEEDFSLTVEGDYPNLIKKIKRGVTLDRQEIFNLIYVLFVYHFRNKSYENTTEQERIIAVRRALKAFFAEEISPVPFKLMRRAGKELFQGLNNWNAYTLKSTTEKLYTSDHPVNLFAIDKHVRFVILPVTPYLCVLGYNHKKISPCSSKLKLTDVERMNYVQTAQSIRAIYSNEDFSIADIQKIKRIFSKRRKADRGAIGTHYRATVVKTEYWNYSDKDGFSFLRVND